jgi:predicted RNA polymerase sigma factor
LTTAQIARAFLVPEATMAQRISRAKRTLANERFEQPGDVRAVLRVLYLMFDQGFAGGEQRQSAGGEQRQSAGGEQRQSAGGERRQSAGGERRQSAGGEQRQGIRGQQRPGAGDEHGQGTAGEQLPSTYDADLAAEAIRLTRQLAASVPDDPEIAGLLALMLLHHARRPARLDPAGELVPLAQQDRTRWDTAMIAEGVDLLQRALARDRLGEYQAQAAIAALHDDAASADETDWPQILEWYDELARITPDNPMVALNRAVAVGHVDGPLAGLRLIDTLDPGLPRRDAAAAYLHERAGKLGEAARLYTIAARSAPSAAERTHLLKQAARMNQADRGGGPP